MPNYLHRTTKDFYQSLSPADLQEPPAAYIEDPDMSAVVGEPAKYWIITGDVVTLASPAQQIVIDAAEGVVIQGERRDEAVDGTTDPEAPGIEVRAMIELLNKRDNYLTNRLVQIQNALETVKASGGNASARLNTLPDNYLATDTRTRQDAIDDYTNDIDSGGAD